MSELPTIQFKDNPAAADTKKFIDITIDTAKALSSWRDSIFSFEWLDAEGNIKSFEDLSADEADKRRRVENDLQKGTPIQKPVLGIGLKDNIEIGSARAEFLTLAAHGIKTIPVHVPKSCESDFKPFLA